METQDLKSRYFAFGCSYTNYVYPTYADYLSATFDISYNYGLSGAGNTFIFNTFLHALTKHDIQKGDVVTIQWSSIPRLDRITNDNLMFECHGLMQNQEQIPKVLVDEFSILQSALELVSYITSIQAIAKDRGITMKMTHMFEPWAGDLLGEPTNHNFKTDYVKQLESKTTLFEQLHELSQGDFFLSKSIEYRRMVDTRNWLPTWVHYPHLGVIVDNHPHTLEHYEIAIQIGKEMNIDTSDLLKNSVLEYVQEIEDWFVNLNTNLNKEFKYFQVDGKPTLDLYSKDSTLHYCNVSPSSILGKIQYKIQSYSSDTDLSPPWIDYKEKQPLLRTNQTLNKFLLFLKNRFHTLPPHLFPKPLL